MSDLKEQHHSNSECAIKLIDNIIKIFDNGHFIFVVGCSGAGKTTLGENFKNEHNWIHFDCDQWALGQDPINDSDKPIDPKSLEKRSKELIDVYDNLAVEKGYYALFKGENPPLSVWTPYYNLLAKEIIKIRLIYNDKNMICSQSVYPYSVRQYLRNIFGKQLIFIILNTSKELLTKRIIDRDTQSAKKRGQTLEEYINSFGKQQFTIETYKNEIGIRFNGFEPIQKDEPQTFQIDVTQNMTTHHVFSATKKIINL